MDTQCAECGEDYPRERLAAGYSVCLACGEKAAKTARSKWTVAPLHKSNYILITDKDDLVGLNNKGGIVRNPI